MAEPTVDQLAEMIERGLLAHPEVDEDRIAEILGELVRAHPHYQLMWVGKQFGGQLYTEPLEDLWLVDHALVSASVRRVQSALA